MKKIIVITILLLSSFNVCSQNKFRVSDLTSISLSAIDSLENALNEVIKKDKKLCVIQGLRQFHIFNFSYNCDISREEYLNQSFLKKIKLCYRSYKIFDNKEYLVTDFLIYDSINNCVAYGCDFLIYGYDRCYDMHLYLMNMFINNEIDFVFLLNTYTDFICVKGDDIFVIRGYKDEIRYYSWVDYVNHKGINNGFFNRMNATCKIR
jgi:phosphopantetheine adenylyltransferase